MSLQLYRLLTMIRMFYLCGFSVLFQALLMEAADEFCLCRIKKVPKTSKEAGRLSSNNSLRDINCTWLITASKGYCVYLTSDHSDLSIWDGKHLSKDQLRKMCGHIFQHRHFSSGRYFCIQNSSWKRRENDRDKSGFDTKHEVEKQVPDRFTCSAVRRAFYFMAFSGRLASYNYPKPYDAAIKCFWQFRINSDYKIILSFTVFNLSYSDGCSNDYVEVDGQKFCGLKKPFTVTMKNSNSRDSRVTFVSNGERKYPGFRATFVARRKTTTVWKLVGIVVGVVSGLCVCTFLCYKFITTDPAEDETENQTVVTECNVQTIREKESII